MELRAYEQEDGTKPFERWFDSLSSDHAPKIITALARMEVGNFSNIKPVGSGVSERIIDFGPGYRVYFARDGEDLIILLGGGTKKRQQNNIDNAKKRWRDYKNRK